MAEHHPIDSAAACAGHQRLVIGGNCRYQRLARYFDPIHARTDIEREHGSGTVTQRVQPLGQARVKQLLAFRPMQRSEEHTSELQSLMRISYAVFCLKKKKIHTNRIQPESVSARRNNILRRQIRPTNTAKTKARAQRAPTTAS